MPRRRAVAIALVGLVVAAGAFVAWFFSREGPAEADLAATARAVTDQSVPTVDDIVLDGTWTVDNTIGEFDIDDTTSTFAGFRVNEAMRGVGSVTAVGRTPGVTGTVEVSGTTLTAGEIVVDFTGIISNDSGRDDNIQDALNTGIHPTASFVVAEPVEFDSSLAAGNPVMAIVPGTMTINGVTNEASMTVEAQVVDGSVLVVGTMDVVFADYDVETPTSPLIVGVDDFGIIEVQLWLSRDA